MHILVFQHIAIEHPGVFRDLLREDGVPWTAVELDDGEAIPDLEDFDALWVMGGPMDTWQEDRHPWLIAEKAAIRRAVVDLKLPFLGVCLGHQLLADALGGKVGPMAASEVGILDVELTEAGMADPLMAGLAGTGKCLQWHGAAVLEPPPGARVLARSPACAVQAIGVGPHAWGLQYHVELTGATVPEWGCVPEYAQALEATLGAGALARFAAEAARHMDAFNRDARLIYRNFMAIARASHGRGS